MTFIKNRSFVFRLSASVLFALIACDVLLFTYITKSMKNWAKEDFVEEFSHTGRQFLDTSKIYFTAIDLANENLVKEIKHHKNNLSDKELIDYTDNLLKSLTDKFKAVVSVRIYVKDRGEFVSFLDKDGNKQNKFNLKTDKIPEYVDFATNEGDYGWTPLIKENDDGEEKLVTTGVMPVSINDDKNFDIFVAISTLSSAYDEIFHKIDGGYFVYWQPDSLITWHPNKDVELKKSLDDIIKEYNISELEQVKQRAKIKDYGFIEMKRSVMYNEPVFLFFNEDDDDWIFMYVSRQSKVYKPIYKLQQQILWSSHISLFVLVLIVVIVCRRGVAPLSKLSSVAKQYGLGDFSISLPPSDTKDEIGDLINAFSVMRRNLIELIDDKTQEAAKKQKQASELEIATKIQKSALPTDFPVSNYLSIFALMNAAKEVGGDFYDFFFIDDDHFAFLIADVSGKGVPAALFMMNGKAQLKNALHSKKRPLADRVTWANNNICSGNEAELFITAFVAVLNVKTGELEFVNCGHNPPLIWKKDTQYTYLNAKKNLILGAMEGIQYKSETVQLEPGDRVFFYTDGITEAQKSDDVQYGEERLKELLNKTDDNPNNIIKTVADDLIEFYQNEDQFDDITMMSLIYKGNNQ
ncbi:MAG: SpoIIE family protein phosphatase [Alphaproteobacteria bacterium]|nr:SpoIIE family protein phosphatase [Alphaproteobacteria bacterium]